MYITAELLTSVRKTTAQKIKLSKYSRDESLLAEFAAYFLDPKDFEQAGKKLGLDEPRIRDCVSRFREYKGEEQFRYSLVSSAPLPMFRIRKELGTTTSAKITEDVYEAFGKLGTKGDVIEWEGTEHVCCLDIDFSEAAPTPHQLIQFCETVKPTPIYLFLSQSQRGVHLIYKASGIFTAEEYAAIAAFSIKRRFPNCDIEFLHRTRFPIHEVLERVPGDETGVLKTLLHNATKSVDATEWLESKGFVIGQRYPHDQCPRFPSSEGKNNTPPVVIHDEHIFCYICNTKGRMLGDRIPGRFPFAALIGERTSSHIAKCVDNFVHWGHAKHILHQQLDNPILARKVYSALLKIQYGDDPRIPFAFSCGEPQGLVRHRGYWADYGGSVVPLLKGSAIIRTFPHAMKAEPNGAVTIDPVVCEWLTMPNDITIRGYLSVTPIFGIQLTQFQKTSDNKIFYVQQTPILQGEDKAKRTPEYIPASHRMDIDTAWGNIHRVFPKLNRELIELLIVARGCSEHRVGLSPMLAITGVTGSGKSSHVDIASAIIGDTAKTVHLNRDKDRFNNELFNAKRESGYVFFDEFFKFAKQANMSDTQAMETLLGFTPQSSIYIINVGGVTFGELPVFVWSDTEIPEDVQTHEQIGRRVFHTHLNNEMTWEKSIAEAGIGEPKYLRAKGSAEIVASCNAILSDVVDRFFTTEYTDFADVAKALGFKRMRDSEAMDDKLRLVRELFEAVCNAPQIEDASDKKRFSPKGFKIAKVNDLDKLYNCLLLCQTIQEKDTTKCRMIAEMDLEKRMKFKKQARFELRKHGAKYAMRFVSLCGTLANGELL